MKKIFTLFLAIGLVACNGDDDNAVANTTNYFPTSANSTWTFNNTDQDTETADTADVMRVNGTEDVNGVSHTNLDSAEIPGGFMVGVLTDNLVRRDGGKLIINGTLGAPIEGFPAITIPLSNVILYDVNTSNGATLSTFSETITETVMELPLTINYTSTSIQGDALASYTTGNQTYTDVIRSRIILNLSISVAIVIGPTTLDVPILTAQDVLVVDNYYAANIGLVFSEATVDYELADLESLGIELPIPESDTQVSTATLAAYSIGN